MKYCLLILVYIITWNLSDAQVYNVEFYSRDNSQAIVVEVDLNFAHDALLVRKEFSQMENAEQVDQSSLVLLGEFKEKDGSIILDYKAYNYFLVPFDPAEGIIAINKLVTADSHQGMLAVNPNDTAATNGGGGITYYCNCGQIGPSGEPGGCVSDMDSKGRITCVEDSGCSSGCRGMVITHGMIVDGGGLLIQVPQTKSRLIHNVATRN